MFHADGSAACWFYATGASTLLIRKMTAWGKWKLGDNRMMRHCGLQREEWQRRVTRYGAVAAAERQQRRHNLPD